VQAIARYSNSQLVVAARAPLRLWIGLALVLVFWWCAWFGPAPFSEHTFFPLWLGYILTVDGLTSLRTGTSLWTRDPRQFALLFLFSIPLWWLFEFANRYLGNWRYLLPRPIGEVEYILRASLAFSTVMPAIFVSAELVRTFAFFAPRRDGPRIGLSRGGLLAVALAGAAMFVLSLVIPRYAFPLVWIGFFLALDPINALLGNPSILAQLREGRWDTVLVLAAAGLTCGFFWEFWNVYAMPKWVYEVPFVGRPKLFELPVLGYGGYPPFALGVFAAWSLMHGVLFGPKEHWLRFTRPGNDANRASLAEAA
jgi:hypothetical protein